MVLSVLCCAGTVPQNESHWFGVPPRGACLPLREGHIPPMKLNLKLPLLHPVDLDSVPTHNEALVINGDGTVHDPFDRPPGEEVVEVIPRAQSRSPSLS